jgi:hypothetical protein
MDADSTRRQPTFTPFSETGDRSGSAYLQRNGDDGDDGDGLFDIEGLIVTGPWVGSQYLQSRSFNAPKSLNANRHRVQKLPFLLSRYDCSNPMRNAHDERVAHAEGAIASEKLV